MMFGTIKGVQIDMDSREFALNFENAFDAKMMSFNISSDVPQSLSAMGLGNLMGLGSMTTVRISCTMHALPIDKHLMEYFHIAESGSFLTEVGTTSRVDPMIGSVVHSVDLTYRTTNFSTFSDSLKKIVYNRFNKQFHEQLEEHLD